MPSGACTTAAPGIVINELLPDPTSSDDGLEWIELHNGRSEPADLSGWQIASGTSTYRPSDPLPAGTVVPAGAYLVVGQPLVEGADVVVAGFGLGNASGSADAVQLRDCHEAVADTVVYGEANPDGWLGDDGLVASSLGPVPGEDGTIGRLPDGRDTDRSGDDFAVLPWPSPGAANDAPPETCGGPGSGLVVNELLPDPDGEDLGREWVELLHAGRDPLDLSGWSVESGTSRLVERFRWSSGVLLPGERLLIGGAEVEGADVVVDDLGLGNGGSSADVVRVVDCLGFPSDTVVYGAPNSDGFADDRAWPAESLAPAPAAGASIQRLEDGLDTDRCGEDFAAAEIPTPGAPNQPIAPAVCVPSDGAIVVNEILPDADGSDIDREWIELFNRSEEEVSLAGWALSLGTRDYDDRDVVLGEEVTIAPRGFLVIGGTQVAEAHVVASLAMGNGTETDGVRLYDCGDQPVDTVLYGEIPNDDRLEDDRGEVVDPYGAPEDGASLARIADGADTDAAGDWRVLPRPTPGAPNTAERAEGAGATVPRGCAGAREPAAAGCRSAPARVPWLAVLVLASLGLGRERRRGGKRG